MSDNKTSTSIPQFENRDEYIYELQQNALNKDQEIENLQLDLQHADETIDFMEKRIVELNGKNEKFETFRDENITFKNIKIFLEQRGWMFTTNDELVKHAKSFVWIWWNLLEGKEPPNSLLY